MVKFVVKNNYFEFHGNFKLSTNSVLDGTIIKVIVENTSVVKHVYNNTYMSIFAAATIIVL